MVARLSDVAVNARREVPPPSTLYDLPTTVDVVTAGAYYDLRRDACYEAARADRFPVPVLRLGKKLRVTRASLIAALDPDGSARPFA